MTTLKEAIVNASKSTVAPEFRKRLKKLSPQVQAATQVKYFRWRKDYHTLNFEPKFSNIYAVEVNNDIHALAEITGTVVRWTWIGNYKDYTHRLDLLRKGT